MNIYELMNMHDSGDATLSTLLPLFSSIAARVPALVLFLTSLPRASVSLFCPQKTCTHKNDGRLSGFFVRTSIVSGTQTGTSSAWACQTGCQVCNQRSVPASFQANTGDRPHPGGQDKGKTSAQ